MYPEDAFESTVENGLYLQVSLLAITIRLPRLQSCQCGEVRRYISSVADDVTSAVWIANRALVTIEAVDKEGRTKASLIVILRCRRDAGCALRI